MSDGMWFNKRRRRREREKVKNKRTTGRTIEEQELYIRKKKDSRKK
jgi:hypothetical protein